MTPSMQHVRISSMFLAVLVNFAPQHIVNAIKCDNFTRTFALGKIEVLYNETCEIATGKCGLHECYHQIEMAGGIIIPQVTIIGDCDDDEPNEEAARFCAGVDAICADLSQQFGAVQSHKKCTMCNQADFCNRPAPVQPGEMEVLLAKAKEMLLGKAANRSEAKEEL